MSSPVVVLLVLALVACKPVDGVVYTDPSRPEAQDWSLPAPPSGPTAALEREVSELRGPFGGGACGKGDDLDRALAELQRARPPGDGEDPAWHLSVTMVRSAVEDVKRTLDDECQGRSGASLSSSLDALERELAKVPR